MNEDEAKALLEVSPIAATASDSPPKGESMADGLTNAMATTDQPELETVGDGEELSADLNQESQLLASFNKATGA